MFGNFTTIVAQISRRRGRISWKGGCYWQNL